MLLSKVSRVVRPPRPPDNLANPQARFRFSIYQSHLSLLYPSITRPQVPFLYCATRKTAHKITATSPITRFLSTESKARWKARMRWQLRFHAFFWPLAILTTLAGACAHHMYLEKKYPTPPDFSFWSRWGLRAAVSRELEPFSRTGIPVVDWAGVGSCYKWVLERLERSIFNGRDPAQQVQGGICMEGVGQLGADISMKSEPWRRGYYQVLMGAARAAEHLDGHVFDRTRRLVFPGDMVIGPSNARPKPRPHGWKESPKEEDCEPAYESPQVFYMRILTTNGFSTRERVDAALAYADWLDFKGLTKTAENMHDWALNIAAGDLSTGPNSVVNTKTGVINQDVGAPPSENVLKASTALGVHHATHGDLQAALPIFVSLLRARKNLPSEPLSRELLHDTGGTEEKAIPRSSLRAISDWLSDAPYPGSPPSGNQPPFHTLKEACEEVGLMTYIGEILFATSSKEKGLSWTRDAVDAAEAVMWMMKEQDKKDDCGKCQECLETGLRNWKKMVRLMASQAKESERKTYNITTAWLGVGQKGVIDQDRKWEEEQRQIELRTQKIAPLMQSFD